LIEFELAEDYFTLKRGGGLLFSGGKALQKLEKLKFGGANKVKDAAKCGGNVLVVDDDVQLACLVCEILAKGGHSAVKASLPNEALRLLCERRFEVVVIDVKLPGMGGFELLRTVKRDHPYTEAIIITGDPEFDNAMKFLKAGAFDYLAKPFESAKMLEKVAAAIASRRERIEMDLSKTAQFMVEERPLSKYVLVKQIGGGALSDTSIVERDFDYFALKCYRALRDFCRDPEDIAAHFIEINQRMFSLDHPNVVRIFEHGFQEGREKPYVVFEYVKGSPLREAIASGRLDFQRRLEIVRQLASAVAKLHENSIVHGDLTPDNILLDEAKGDAKLVEFGLSSLVKYEARKTCANPGLFPCYMAPEVLSKAVERPEIHSDVFALGTVIYEILTGRPAFPSESLDEIQLSQFKPKRPELPEPKQTDTLLLVLGSMLQKDPSKRIASDEALSALNVVCTMPDMLDTIKELFNTEPNRSVWS